MAAIPALLLSIRRELAFLRVNPWDRALVTWIPVVALAVIFLIFSAGSARELPIALVDTDHSSLSRQLTRLLQASSVVKPVLHTNNLSEAQSAVRKREVYAIVYIPPGAERDALRGNQATIYSFANYSYYSQGGLITRDIAAVVSRLNELISPSRTSANRTVNKEEVDGPPVAVQLTTLFNPEINYEWGLATAVFPALLLLMMSAAFTVVIWRQMKKGATRQWLDEAGGRVSLAVLYKLLPYCLLFTLFGAAAVITYGFQGWPVNGSLWLILLAQFVMYFTYGSAMVVFLAVGRGDILTALSLSSMFCTPALTYGNVLFPVNEASTFVQVFGSLLPYSHYIVVQVQQMQMGASIGDSMPFLLPLAGYGLALFVLGCFLLSRFLRRVPEEKPI